jgi:predicted ester cyclase
MKDGGPAFPSEVINEVSSSGGRQDWKNYKGMSLRDYFAANADNHDIDNIINNAAKVITRQQARYIHADAMLEVREK